MVYPRIVSADLDDLCRKWLEQAGLRHLKCTARPWCPSIPRHAPHGPHELQGPSPQLDYLHRVRSLLSEKGPSVHELGPLGIGRVSQRHELGIEGFCLLPIARQLGGAAGTGEGAEAVRHLLQ
jgi:hypothetical protein